MPKDPCRLLGFKLSILHLAVVAIFIIPTAGSYGQPPQPSVEVVAVGDILLARGVNKQIEGFGFGYPFEKVQDVLEGADIAFGNLENPLSDNCSEAGGRFSFRGKPAYSQILKTAGIDIFSLANNHILDCGQTGLLATIDALRTQNLLWVGAGKTDAEAGSPLLMEIRGVKLGFIAFTLVPPAGPQGEIAKVSSATVDRVARAVATARAQADVVIVSFHWGTEYSTRPNAGQVEMANAAVKAGADVILGHHPHVLQALSMVEGRSKKRQSLIAYSLGNFVFDSPKWVTRHVVESMILKIRVSKSGLVDAGIVPIQITGSRPDFASKRQKKQILDRLNMLSQRYGTVVADDGKLQVSPGTALKDQ